MMTLDETSIFNNMTNAIKNLEQSKSISNIIDDLDELIFTLSGRNHARIDVHEPDKADISVHGKTVIKADESVKWGQIKTETVIMTKAETKGTKAKAEPVPKQAKTKDKAVPKAEPKAPAPAPGPATPRSKI